VEARAAVVMVVARVEARVEAMEEATAVATAVARVAAREVARVEGWAGVTVGGEMEEVVMGGMAMEAEAAEVAEVAEVTVAVARVEVAMAREKRGSVVGMAMA